MRSQHVRGRHLVLLVAAGTVVAGGITVAANAGGYPIKCINNIAITVDHSTGAQTQHTTIQEAVEVAKGDEAGSGAGDTVIVCHGTFAGFDVPLADSAGPNSNVTIRSYDGSDQTKIVGSDPTLPVISVEANGIVLGGPGLGLYVTGTASTGIQIGAPAAPNLDESDDQELTECLTTDPPPAPGNCGDEEKAAATPINVSVIGNRVRDLTNASGSVTGIAVNNSNNTLVYRNLVERLSSTGGLATGIRFGDTNANNHVLQNAVHQLTATGGDCTTSNAATPTLGAIGVAIQDEALDALVHDTLVDNLVASCTAVGIYSNAWGGLENDRNGQQIPIATDFVGNRVTKISSATGDSNAVSIAPVAPDNGDGSPNPPSSFRVLANDLQDAAVAVGVYTQMAPYSYVEENDFDHDSIGVLNTGNVNLDATNNWWGCQEGPASGKKECATIVTNTPGTTSYNPWLRSHVDHAGEHAGEWAGHG